MGDYRRDARTAACCERPSCVRRLFARDDRATDLVATSRRASGPLARPRRLIPMTVARGSRIPLVDLGAQYETIRDEVLPTMEAVLRRSAFIHGPFVAVFEQEMTAF